MTNKYAGHCARCGSTVAAGDGEAVRQDGRWIVRHLGNCPPAAPATNHTAAPAGIYRAANGDIVVVKESRGQKDIPVDQRRRYAVRLVNRPEGRLTVEGQGVAFDWEYAPGAATSLTIEQRVPLHDQQVTALMIATGKCICCGRGLYAEATMKRIRDTGIMVGPVCAQMFA